MNLKQYFLTLWKWLWLIVLSTALAGGFSYVATSRIDPTYLSRATLMVGQAIKEQNPDPTLIGLTNQLAQNYLQIVKRPKVLQSVVETLKLPMSWDRLSLQVTANMVAGTQLMDISVIDTNPQRAKVIADEIARQLIAQSPTPNEQQQERTRGFVQGQMADLENEIKQLKDDIEKLRRDRGAATSARAIQDIDNKINTKQAQLTTDNATYATYLDFVKGGVNTVSVFEPASDGAQIGPQRTQNTLLGAAIGLALAIVAAFLLEYLDDTIKDGDDVLRVTGLSTLGLVTRMPQIKSPADRLITATQPKSPIAEAYRVLRTNLQFSGLKNQSSTLLVTSASPGEGKSTTAANLAVIMAQGQKRVVLVDADLHRPSVHRIFGVSNRVGLTSLLLDETMGLDVALQWTNLSNLRVLTTGPLPPNPADVLNSAEVTRIIERLRQEADLIIFDSPPVFAVTDAVILAGKLLNTLIVVDTGRTRSDMLRREVDALNRAGAKVFGVVLNKLSEKATSSAYYYYYDYTASRDAPRRWWQRAPKKRRKVASTPTVPTPASSADELRHAEAK
jgi:non-specific protein-tyrosine kinase